jgi:imidazolonepropionase-like amidohydrolase
MRLWGAAAAATAVLACAAGSASAKTVAVTADRMIDVVTGKVIEHPVVVIRDERITAVGVQGQLQIPAGAQRIDLPGRTLLPGLIDMHVHLTADPTFGGYTSLQYTDNFWVVLGTRHAKDTLDAGFTTVRNVGSDNYDDVALREAVDGGFIPGPRIVTATYAMGATGGHCDSTFFPPEMDQKAPLLVGAVDQQLTFEEMKAAVDEAHRLGLKVAAHAHGTSGIHDAILAGVDTIEHASLADDEDIRLAKAKGAYFSMDIYNTDYTQSEGRRNGVLEENLKKDRDIAELQREAFEKATKAGVKMIFGTDAGVYPHGTNAKQFAVMVKWGMSPLQAIQAATTTAAEALGRQGDVGTIQPGRYGDLIAVKGDPLTDVSQLERVDFVMKGGEVVKAAR